MTKDVEFSPAEIIASLLNFVAYIISPILFIWAVNTLFGCGISMTFKSWLAGLVLIMLVRFHLRGANSDHGNYDDSYYDYDDFEDDEDDKKEDAEEQMIKLKAKLVAYQNHKNKKNSRSDES